MVHIEAVLIIDDRTFLDGIGWSFIAAGRDGAFLGVVAILVIKVSKSIGIEVCLLGGDESVVIIGKAGDGDDGVVFVQPLFFLFSSGGIISTAPSIGDGAVLLVSTVEKLFPGFIIAVVSADDNGRGITILYPFFDTATATIGIYLPGHDGTIGAIHPP